MTITLNRLEYYLRLWLLMSRYAFASYLNDRVSFVLFLVGKVVRFILYTAFIIFLLKSTQTLAGYNLDQTLFFFLTFNLVDTISQFLFRAVYRFRPLVIEGGLDFVLAKPSSALFRILFGGADILDLFTIPPLIVITYLVGRTLDPTLLQIVMYIALLINSLVIATAFHIAVLSLGIITLEIDHTIMIYRDLTNLGRFPIDIYKEPIKSILTFIVPVGIMMTFPAKVLLGVLSPLGILVSLVVSGLLLFLALRFWNYGIKTYTSASS